mmetsp:Transcript_29136/g.71080  ORF Transcript_29136/g.71080 Transcript_29136/m.71080 type:complete len:95 (+) Transcript_29136:1288-1572(+)
MCLFLLGIVPPGSLLAIFHDCKPEDDDNFGPEDVTAGAVASGEESPWAASRKHMAPAARSSAARRALEACDACDLRSSRRRGNIIAIALLSAPL